MRYLYLAFALVLLGGCGEALPTAPDLAPAPAAHGGDGGGTIGSGTRTGLVGSGGRAAGAGADVPADPPLEDGGYFGSGL